MSSFYNSATLLSSDIDGLMWDYSISRVLVMEILQFCTKPSIWFFSKTLKTDIH